MRISFAEEFKTLGTDTLLYDHLVCALGFESRCTNVAKMLASQSHVKTALAFTDRNTLSFPKNEAIFSDLGFETISWMDRFSDQTIAWRLPDPPQPIQVAVDVTSMTRKMAALVLNHICNSSEFQGAKVTIFYSPAKYVPPKKVMVPVSVVGPVIPEYAGWTAYPERASFALLGLGYEYGRAIGALDYLDVSDTWAFIPTGTDPRFETKVNQVNANLLSVLDRAHKFSYPVLDPYDTFIQMRSLAEGLLSRGRVIVLPFGPKLFSALGVILAEYFGKEVSVWRVSATTDEAPADRVATGDVTSFTFQLDAD